MIGDLGILFLIIAAIGLLFVVGCLLGDYLDRAIWGHQERADARRRNRRG